MDPKAQLAPDQGAASKRAVARATRAHGRKLAPPSAGSYLRTMDTRSETEAGMEQVGYLAIRQPAIIYFLQRELWSRDGDALAAGLAVAHRVVCELTASAGGVLPRLSHHELAAAIDEVRRGGCERQTVRWLRDQIDELEVVLTRAEEDAVATVMAGVLWAAARAQLPGELLAAAG